MRQALGALSLLIACSCAPTPPCVYAPIARTNAPSAPYRYNASAGPGAAELCVEVTLPRGTARLQVLPRLAPFIRDVEVASGGGDAWKDAPSEAFAWALSGCAAAGCRARYRVSIAAAARRIGDEDFASEYRGAFLTPISSWLLAPDHAPPDARYHLLVQTPPGISFVTGTFPDKGGGYGGLVSDISDAPYGAFGPLSVDHVAMPGGFLDIALSQGVTALPRAEIERWIERQARALSDYFGRFPIPHALVLVRVGAGRGVGNGKTTGNGGGSVLLTLGERTTAADLADDWILVHELCHVAFPDVSRAWAEEGLSTYLEPLVRARAGLLAPEEVWRQLVLGLPQGLPEAGDAGLDHTDTWGRRYWGGALFWLIGDMEIRKATANTRSLDDALRAIIAKGGNASVNWSLEQTLEEGDRAVGGTVLTDLRHRMGESPVTVDLDELWRQLGVQLSQGKITYDEAAPFAKIRQGITAPRGG